MEDKQIACKDCGNEFTFTAGEQEFFEKKGLDNDPVRCPDCRKKRKTGRGNGGGHRGGGGKNRNYNS